ncbi:MAG TPA: hypothetical protein PLT00_12695 [Verrucomicrobiota bacterium]|nr:hypothetical protein [Verrucomicrobiota bacterium]HQB17560.1 hypothetical protein [Verrucomicrobiota bacterium]
MDPNDQDQVKNAGCDVTQGIENTQVLNRMLLDRIAAAAEGEVKAASAAGTNMLRRRIREEGFTRRIIPLQTVTNEDLDRVLEHDRPVIIEDMEPLSKGAKSIPFGDSADTQFFYGNKYAVVFNPITTPEWTKDINELRTYRMDLRQVITDNSLKDIQTEEDGKFIALCDTVVGAVGGVGAAGVAQNFNIAGGITRDTYVEVLSKLEDQNLNNGVILMNRRTAKEFLKFNRSEIGGSLAQDMFKQGLTALQEATIFGVKHVFTIKRNLVPDNVIYIFTEPGFLFSPSTEFAPLTRCIDTSWRSHGR